MDKESSKNFLKTLGLFDATAIVAGAMIGSGIFMVSAGIAQDVKTATLLLLTWLIGGALTMIGALSYGEYAASFPYAGGQYVYISKVWGKLSGFLYGWALFLAIQTGSIAAVSIAFAKFLGILCPTISSDKSLFHFLSVHFSSQQLIAIILIISLTIINTKGAQLASKIQNIITTSNIIALSGIIICGLFIGVNHNVIAANFSHPFTIPQFDSSFITVLGAALVGGLFAFDGWNNLTFIAAEVKDTEKILPKALMFGTGIVIILYLLTNLSYLCVLPIESVQNAENGIVGATFMQTIFGEYGKFIISAIILVAAFGCVNSMILSGSRVYYAMAKDGLFFKSLATLSPQSKVPVNSLLVQSAWSILLVMSGTFGQLLDYVIFVSVLFYVVTVGGLFVYRKKYPDIPRPYKALGYPVLPAIYCIVSTFILVTLLIYKPLYTWPGLIIIFIGIPVFYFWEKKLETEKTNEECTI